MKRTQVKRELKLRRKEIKTLQKPQLENVTGGHGTFGGTYTCSSGGGKSSTTYCGTF